jgi:hypothetical protein
MQKRKRRKNGHKVINLMTRHMMGFTREVLLSSTHSHEVFVFCLKESVRKDTEVGGMDFSRAPRCYSENFKYSHISMNKMFNRT